MKKRALSGAVALGLLLLGAAAWPQDPTAGEPVARQADRPSFRDVLRGKVGQECNAKQENGVWTLSFPFRAEDVFVLPYYPRPGSPPENAEKARERHEAEKRPAPLLATLGQDFVQLRDADGAERFIPLSRVDVMVRLAGK